MNEEYEIPEDLTADMLEFLELYRRSEELDWKMEQLRRTFTFGQRAKINEEIEKDLKFKTKRASGSF